MNKFEQLMKLIQEGGNLSYSFMSNVFTGIYFKLYNEGFVILHLNHMEAKEAKMVCDQLGVPSRQKETNICL